MSLFSSIQLASNSLRATQIGLQVVGQNIANASTPGYSREEVVLSPAPTQRKGGILLGLGVQVQGVVQKVDEFIEERLRGAKSDRASADAQQQAYFALESIINELSDTDLSTLLTGFFASLQDMAGQPEDLAVRSLVTQSGQTLASSLNRLSRRVGDLRSNLNEQVIWAAGDINRLTEEVRTLNLRITEAEGGGAIQSDAGGLRDRRRVALGELAELIDVKVAEQPSGGVAVFAGGEFLVFEGRRQEVSVALETDRGLATAEVQMAETKSPLLVGAGRVGGLVVARDNTLGEFLDQLDDFAATLAFEFNKIHSAGQGLSGFEQVTSEGAVSQTDVALDAAGLTFTPTSGVFTVSVFNRETAQATSQEIFVDLDGLNTDTTFDTLAAALDAVDGITATVTPAGRLSIASQSPDMEFAFSGDTSGTLAALGINTFFRGSTAADLGVNDTVVQDPGKIAASQGGIGVDEKNALALTAFADQPIELKNDASILALQGILTAEVARESAVARSVAEGFKIFEETLMGQKMATSGVSLDEEAVRLITLQRTYQASARYIATISELLDALVNL